MINKTHKWIKIIMVIVLTFMIVSDLTYATVPVPELNIEIGTADTPEAFGETLQILFLLTVLALAPSILVMMTSFTRIIITLNFLKSALGTPQMPPSQILVGLALFLTFFIMSPVLSEMNELALVPYQSGEITQEEAIDRGLVPVKSFMLRQTRDEDVRLFMDLAGLEPLADDTNIVNELPLHVVTPAFIISELRAGFIIGFLIYLPFIVIDMVVSSTLMAMGMMMLPPATISLPFKILLFILVDGWHLLVGQLVQTFQ